MPRMMYATATELIQYAADRGVSVTEQIANKQLMLAQDYIDGTYSFRGEPVYVESAFPRTGLEDFPETMIPPIVSQATLKVALMLINDTPIMEGTIPEAQIKREVVATNKVETEYATNYAASRVQSNIILPSLLRMFEQYNLITVAGIGVNLYGVRG